MIFIFTFIIIALFIVSTYCRAVEYLILRKAPPSDCPKSSHSKPVQSISERNKSFYVRILRFLWIKIDPYLYGWMRYCVIMTGHLPSYRLRNFLYRHVFRMKITSRTVILGGCEFRSPWNIKADNCVISTGCILDGRRGITIGNNTVFGGNVRVWTEEHDFNDADFVVQGAEVVFGDRCWICSDSTILPGVHVDEGAVIASKSCVTKDCEAYTVYAGIPARKIADRNRNLHYKLSGKRFWHFY